MLLGLSLAGCGDDGGLPDACTREPAAVQTALRAAPGPVRVDGTPLSACVTGAGTDAELQEIGLVLTRAADHLAARARQHDAAAALALGYLVGAARRGAASTSGMHAELVRRLEQSAAFLERAAGPLASALRRGMRAGQNTG